ncbi:MAG TPA: hypothetical protein VIY47_17100 [Ignavibacteriaceae bacterium]
MSGFENHSKTLQEIEKEIYRKGIALSINWDNPSEVYLLAQEALDHPQIAIHNASHLSLDINNRIKSDIFGLAAMMLKTMEESAREGFELHGGEIWKKFGKELFRIHESQRVKQ